MFNIFKKKKPNVIMITIDQFRQDLIKDYDIFNRLQGHGVYLKNMITYAPYTVASLHAYMTGMYGNKNGTDSYYGAPKFKKDKCETLASYLKNEGYYTHADYNNEIIAPHKGFDKIEVHKEDEFNLKERHIDMIKDINKKHKQYFLYLQFSTIHISMVQNVIKKIDQYDKDYFDIKNRNKNIERYKNYLQYGIEYMETILDYLEKNKILDNTILIIQTDHGCSLGERSGELAYGVYCYDYTVKVWAYLICKNILPQNHIVKPQIRTIDILPTVLDILNIEQKNESLSIQGKSIMDMINRSDNEDREAFIQTAPLDGKYSSPYSPNIHALRYPEWKLIYNETADIKELYNLKEDPEEKTNLAGTGLKIEEEMWVKLNRM